MDNLPKRLSLIRGGRKQKAFADSLGVNQNYISRYEAGKIKPSFEFLKSVAEKENININWLLTGKGEMYLSENKSKSELIKEIAELKRDRQKVNDAIVSQVTDLTKIITVTDQSKKLK